MTSPCGASVLELIALGDGWDVRTNRGSRERRRQGVHPSSCCLFATFALSASFNLDRTSLKIWHALVVSRVAVAEFARSVAASINSRLDRKFGVISATFDKTLGTRAGIRESSIIPSNTAS